MAKVKARSVDPEQRRLLQRRLVRVLTQLSHPREADEFLRFLLTPSEVVMLGRRLSIADALLRGDTYQEIRDRLGVGLTTVQFMDRWVRRRLPNYLHAGERKRHQARLRRRLRADERKRIARVWRSLRIPSRPSLVRVLRTGPYPDEEDSK